MVDLRVFVFVGVYPSQETARADYEALRNAHAAGTIGTYDAANVFRDAAGRVYVHKHEKPTQHGAWTGAGVGALLGVLFPPSIVGAGVAGAGAGGLVGHLWRGMSRSDARELGEVLDAGQAGLIVFCGSRFAERAEEILSGAENVVKKELAADPDELEHELQKAERSDDAHSPSS